jgi:hypothetical protein
MADVVAQCDALERGQRPAARARAEAAISESIVRWLPRPRAMARLAAVVSATLLPDPTPEQASLWH